MRFPTIAVALCLSAFASANETPHTTSSSVQTETSTDSSFAIQTAAPDLDDELKKRQAPGQIVGQGVPNSPDPTQMSPITTFMKYGPDGKQTPVAYTQTFAPVPDQWDSPKSGSIGLGDIQGQVGVVKTKVRRNFVAEATAAVKRGLERRKGGSGGGHGGGGGSSGGHGSSSHGGSGGGGGHNAASAMAVPLVTVAAVLTMGVLALVL